jgi:hypothetical protein
MSCCTSVHRTELMFLLKNDHYSKHDSSGYEQEDVGEGK